MNPEYKAREIVLFARQLNFVKAFGWARKMLKVMFSTANLGRINEMYSRVGARLLGLGRKTWDCRL